MHVKFKIKWTRVEDMHIEFQYLICLNECTLSTQRVSSNEINSIVI